MSGILHLPRRRLFTPAMATVKAKAGSAWSLKVRNLSTRADGDVFEMIINGMIGASWYDDSATASNEFRTQFNSRPKGSKVHVRINSDGGSVGDALEIYNICQSQEGLVTTFNDGYALSSASIIFCGGGRAIAPDASLTMIHEPWSGTVGDETDHLRSAKMLAKHGELISGIYAKRMGTTPAEMRALMKDETWYTGAEARAAGLADEVEEEEFSESQDSRNAAHFAGVFSGLDFSRFDNVPRRIQNHVRNCIKEGRKIFTPSMASRSITAPADSTFSFNISAANTATPGAAGTTNIMDKAKILAALKDAGINLPADATDDAILAAFAKLGQDNLAAAKASAKSTGDVEALRTQLDNEKRVRVSAEVARVGENRIANANLKWWVDLAMKDEAGTMAQISALPLARPGGEPVTSVSLGVENRLEEIRKLPTAQARYNIFKQEWNGLYADARARDDRRGGQVQNANTYSSTLVTAFLLDGCVTKLQHMWAPLRVFTRDYSADRYKPLAAAQLKYVTSGSTVQKNATNFESGNAVVAPCSITVDQYSASFNVSNSDLNSGLRMENLIDINVAGLADKILGVAFGPLATGSFTTNAAIVRTATAFAFSDMADAWGRLKKSPVKHAVLDGEYMARIINNPAFYQATGTESGGSDGWKRFGWDGVHLNTNWTGTNAGAGDQNIRGLFCNPQVIGAVAGLPITPPNVNGAVLQQSTIQIPGVDISVEANTWFALSSRTQWMSYDLMFGAALLDESAGVLLTSA